MILWAKKIGPFVIFGASRAWPENHTDACLFLPSSSRLVDNITLGNPSTRRSLSSDGSSMKPDGSAIVRMCFVLQNIFYVVHMAQGAAMHTRQCNSEKSLKNKRWRRSCFVLIQLEKLIRIDLFRLLWQLLCCAVLATSNTFRLHRQNSFILHVFFFLPEV